MNKWLQILGVDKPKQPTKQTVSEQRLAHMKGKQFVAEDLAKEFGCSRSAATTMTSFWSSERKIRPVGKKYLTTKPRIVYEVI